MDALQRTLLDTESIAYSGSLSDGYLSTELFHDLGIAHQVLAKSKRIQIQEGVGPVVARGEAEIGFQQISELLPVPRNRLRVTPPEAVQKITIFRPPL